MINRAVPLAENWAWAMVLKAYKAWQSLADSGGKKYLHPQPCRPTARGHGRSRSATGARAAKGMPARVMEARCCQTSVNNFRSLSMATASLSSPGEPGEQN